MRQVAVRGHCSADPMLISTFGFFGLYASRVPGRTRPPGVGACPIGGGGALGCVFDPASAANFVWGQPGDRT